MVAALSNFWKVIQFLQAGKAIARVVSCTFATKKPLAFLSMVTHWSRSASHFYLRLVTIWYGEFMRKIHAASGNLFADSWSWQSFVFLTIIFHWKKKIVLLFMAGLFIGFLVKNRTACQKSHRKSSFSEVSLLLVLDLAKCVSDSGLTWWLSRAAFRLV